MQGRIIGNIANNYKIMTESGEYSCYARGKFRNQETTPIVGDNVEILIINEEKREAIIEEIKERKNEIKRPKIANIDQIIFIISTKNPKPDLLMLDKQLAYANKIGIEAIIVINKMDLQENYKKIQEEYTNVGYKTIVTSVKDEEKEAIKDEKEYQVGIDALTIAVNPENPVTGVLDDLSTEQIVSLFSGKYATWKDLDPSLPDEKVVVITRDINGGAHEVFQKNIMGDTEVSSEAIQASSMGELVQDIIDNKYAIGYASFGVANQNAGKVVTLKVNGVEPTKENIIDGSYIIQRPLLIVGSGDPTDVQQAFLDVILGETGQKTVEDMGFIPMK